MCLKNGEKKLYLNLSSCINVPSKQWENIKKKYIYSYIYIYLHLYPSIYNFIHYFSLYIYIYIYIYVTVSHRSEYTPHIFVNIFYFFSCDNTEEMTLCYNVM